jgi:hypothetical protein
LLRKTINWHGSWTWVIAGSVVVSFALPQNQITHATYRMNNCK